MTKRTSWDAVIVGAGVGSFVAAGLLARSGRRALLLEAHETPGGCAGFYEAGGFTFDAGATTLIGFDPGDPLATIAEAHGIRLGEDLRLVSPRLLPLLPSFGKTVSDVLERARAPADPAFRAVLDLALLISVQSPASAAPWWNGALGIDLFRRGVSRARGGMRAFAEALAGAVVRAGGETRILATRLSPSSTGWIVKTASGEELAARPVLPNLSVRDVARLLEPGTGPERRASGESMRLGDGWGALGLNLGLSRVVNGDPRRLHRLVAMSAALAAERLGAVRLGRGGALGFPAARTR